MWCEAVKLTITVIPVGLIHVRSLDQAGPEHAPECGVQRPGSQVYPLLAERTDFFDDGITMLGGNRQAQQDEKGSFR